MDMGQIITVLGGNAVSVVLAFAWWSERKDHAETRANRESDNKAWLERYTALVGMIAGILPVPVQPPIDIEKRLS